MSYSKTVLTSNLIGTPFNDPNLVNAWGLARTDTSPWWVSNTGTGTSTIYQANGSPFPQVPQPLVVTIPGGDNTGVVANPYATSNPNDFVIPNSLNTARFIFVTENGTIAAWSTGTSAVTVVDRSSVCANYKGVAIGEYKGVRYLYVANFASGRVEVFDAQWNLVKTFSDPCLYDNFIHPDQRYAPFNLLVVRNRLFVTFALQDPNHRDDVRGENHGVVSVFKLSGKFVHRLITKRLNSPWGLAVAPSNFGRFSNALLVGNFGDGQIHAFDFCGKYLGTLRDSNNLPIVIDGLWAIAFGAGGSSVNNSGNSNDLYFTAGPNNETNGQFGVIRLV
jgi:uncharacterized protein (TIGR03118 family)